MILKVLVQAGGFELTDEDLKVGTSAGYVFWERTHGFTELDIVFWDLWACLCEHQGCQAQEKGYESLDGHG